MDNNKIKEKSNKNKIQNLKDDLYKSKDNFNLENILEQINNIEKDIHNLKNEKKLFHESKLKLLADNENLKKRMYEEQENLINYRSSSLAYSLLDSIDNFEMALSMKGISKEIDNFLIGFKMIYQNIIASLNKENIYEMKTKIGDKFDHNIHEAIEQIESDKYDANHIIAITKKGYKIKNKVLRHAQVKVSK